MAGWELLGGLAQGFAQGKSQAQDRKLRENLQASQIDLAKQHAKLYEAQVRTAGLKEQMQSGLMDFIKGGGLGSPAGPMGTPEMQPQIGPQEPQPFSQYSPPAVGGGFNDLINRSLEKQGLGKEYGPLINEMVRLESGFNPNAVSGAGAQGLMQLMPGTARGLGVTDPFDPAQNINGGVAYFKQQLDRFGGNVPNALAAYNAGPGAVDKYGGVPPYAETQNYVARLQKYAPQALAVVPPTKQTANSATPTLDFKSLPMQQRVALDVMFKQGFDLDTKFRDNKTEVKGNRETGYDVFQNGQMVGRLPGMGKTEMVPITTPTGKYLMPYNVPPAGQQGMPIQTEPNPNMLPPVPNQGSLDKLRSIDETLASIDNLRRIGQDPNVYGYFADLKHRIYQDPGSPLKATAKWLYENVQGGQSDPNLAKFKYAIETFNSAIRYQLYAGNLTPNEAERYMKQAAESADPKQLNAVLDEIASRNVRNREILGNAMIVPPAVQATRPTLTMPQPNRQSDITKQEALNELRRRGLIQ